MIHVVLKARRGHLDSISRGPNGTFSSSGGRGSQGGEYGKDDSRLDEDKKKPKKDDKEDKDEKKPNKSGKIGPIRTFSKTEQMHRPVPRKPLKLRYGGKKKPGPPAGETL